jgi:hypothetical protein
MLTIEQTAAFIVSLFHPTEDTTADSNYTVPEIGGNSNTACSALSFAVLAKI